MAPSAALHQPAAPLPQLRNAGPCPYVKVLYDAGRYVEFNFAPSRQWAAYAFTGYREGMTELACAPPQIKCTAREGVFEMTVTLDLPESLRTVDVMAGSRLARLTSFSATALAVRPNRFFTSSFKWSALSASRAIAAASA